ncbi:hypothetical protein Tfer_0433 [Thermincola ferriacetica]|uniref:CobQ/CobB/MinD/ParA nucleotide binding domain-containing protein n=1 Tax=Thermincola ferriacetica TaxID=281456 RepID=A0A0L6W6L7_9FIRM|nr:hypothetical protein [Thermincola ferriacetica]KNZ70754.1 hypothetical protein Tfer_0433 [Thermincola ferriacetica]
MAIDYAQKRITIFTGHYGSGKTEISINYALRAKDICAETTLVDLDFVNPYFRSREAKNFLDKAGITVLASVEDCFDTDLPAFSPRINGVLKNHAARVIIDLGGDEIGARAAGRFRNHISDDAYEMFFVINPFRPFTTGVTEVRPILERIEAASRLKVTALVSNPNLLSETTLADIIAGHNKVLEMARSLELPVKFLAVEKKFTYCSALKAISQPVLEIDRSMLAPWE